ncbi:YqgQ family protein [Pediococcus argentinicus]|uniref:YqgQ family protein n=1 Tax=Pediococcus argentinicus TaxID=480391 RepID=UPI00338DAD6E
MKTLYDVQQLLKKFGIFVYVGKRKWDIDLMRIELQNLHKAGVVPDDQYMKAILVLRREYHIEELREKHPNKNI